MKTVALPIENKVREFDGKLWLGLNFVEKDYNIVLGPSYEIKSTIDLIKPDVYFAKDTGDGNIPFFKKLKESGITVCGISPESAVNSEIKHYAQQRAEVMNIFDAYFSWGEEPAEAVNSQYHDTDINLKTTGNPRFDLLTKPLRDIYSDGGDKIQTDYGDYILVNTNFGMGNPTDREKLFELIRRHHPDRDPYHEENVYSRILYSFFELIFYLLSSDIGCKIILRPHPGEDHSTYRKAFSHIDNVHVRHEGDVRSWIYGSDGVIHYDCTTGIEAALMGTPVLSYQPLSDQPSDQVLSQIVSQTATTRQEVKEWIVESVASEAEYTMNSDQESAVRQYFPNMDRLAAPLVCEAIDQLVDDSSGFTDYQIGTKTKIERSVKKYEIWPELEYLYDKVRDIQSDGEFQRKRKRKRQKFPNLSYGEIAKKSEIMSGNIGLKNYTIKKRPRTRNTYAIHKN